MNKEKRNEYARQWYAANRERLLEKERNRVKTPEQKERHLISSRKYYLNHKEKCLALTRRRKLELRILKPPIERKIKIKPIKIHIKLTPEEIREKDRLKYYKRKSQIQARNKLNRDVINKKYLIKTKERFKTDPLFKLRRDISNLIRISINRQGYSKNSKTRIILGCSIEDFKRHLESKFESWMTWENRGKYNGELNYGWDIDHIIPVSSAQSQEEIIRLNHYTNLQPLDSFINRYVKKDKVA